MNILKHIRLLPIVVVVGTGLLAIKGVDIARAAANVSAADPDQQDNSGLAPAMPASKPTTDFADDDTATGSAGEADVLTSLTKRRAELDARERALSMRENMLNAGEGRVDQKITALKDLQSQIQALLGERDAKQEAQIASLVKTYSAMKPKDAARIFNSLSDDVLIPVAKGMKSDVLAPVMAAMSPDAAQKLTVKLAALLKLPESAPGALCPTPVSTAADATPPAPAGTPVVTPLPNATTNPPVTPLQTAAVTPPPAPAATPAAAPAPTPAAAPAPAAPKPQKPVVRHVTPKPAPAKAAAASAPAPSPKAATPTATPPDVKPATTTPAAAAASAPSTPAPTKPAATPAATSAPTPLTPPAPAPTK